MREILFRGKRVDNGEWVFGDLGHSFNFNSNEANEWNPTIKPLGEEAREVIPETVSEFTGLPDKNGKKIFEGDIVCHDFNGQKTEVVFHQGCFHFQEKGCVLAPIFPFIITHKVGVVGNIHDKETTNESTS